MNRIALSFILLVISVLILIPKTSFTEELKNIDKDFIKAVYAENIDLMQKLLNDGANINTTDKDGLLTPLGIAAAGGNIQLVDFLLSKGANPGGVQSSPNLPIYLAISQNRIAVVKRFLDLGISPNYAWPRRDGGTLLITAVQFGYIEIVELLIQRGADLNFCGNSDYSPLYRSIIYDRYRIFRFLVNRGARLNAKDRIALSKIKWETVERNYKFIEYLKKENNETTQTKPREARKGQEGGKIKNNGD